MTPRHGEEGYALVAAVVSIAVFALMSLAMINAAGGSQLGVAAEIERAKLAAAAQAGTTIAISNLLGDDRARRWSPDGRTRRVRFDDVVLAITVEDERGKIPLNLMEDKDVRTMFEALGTTGERLDVLTDSFLDWRDQDDESRPEGAEASYYDARGLYPRNGPLRSIDELILIRGMDRALLERLRPAVSVNFGSGGGFDPRFAHPFALAVMGGGGLAGPAVIERQRELAGQRPALEIGENLALAGRPLTIRVLASGPQGAAYRRAVIVELTGAASLPYVIRNYE